jgi:hypothetical protein
MGLTFLVSPILIPEAWPLFRRLPKKPHNHPVLSYLSKPNLSTSTQIVESQLSFLTM